METLIGDLLLRLKEKTPIDDLIEHIIRQPLLNLQPHLVELTILSLERQQIAKSLVDRCQQVPFYCKVRNILCALTSNISSQKINTRKQIIQLENQIDQHLVNCNEMKQYAKLTQQQHLIAICQQKQLRSQFIINRKQLFQSLRILSQQLKQLRDNDLQGTNLFNTSLKHINDYLEQLREGASIKYTDFDCSMIVYRGQTKTIKTIVSQGSRFLKTKNRSPLVLNLEFGRFIFKVDSLLQNQLVSREITRFLVTKLPFIRFVTFDIIPLPQSGAFYEFIENAETISEVKKKYEGNLKLYYEGWPNCEQYLKAFTQSLVGFAIQQYVLQLKDRHNENLMINSYGQICHIDLAYIFNCKLPWGLETVPFKLPKQYIQLMGGFDSDNFQLFESQLVNGFSVLIENLDELLRKIEIFKMMPQLKCFENFSLQNYRKLFPNKTEDIRKFVEKFITDSYDSWRVSKYDSFQYKINGILP